MDKQEFKTQLEQLYKSYFPYGYFHTSEGVLGGETLFFRIGLIGDVNHCPHKIQDNDPARAIFRLDNYTIDTITGTRFSCIPVPGTYYAMECRKIPFRKATKKSYEEILKYMDMYFDRMSQFIQDNKQDVYGGLEQYPEIYFRKVSKLEKALK
jgi:hypothetical protein